MQSSTRQQGHAESGKLTYSLAYLHTERHVLRAKGGSLLLGREGLSVTHKATGTRGALRASMLWGQTWPRGLSLENTSSQRHLVLPEPQRTKSRTPEPPLRGERWRALARYRKNTVIHEGGRAWLVKHVLA